MSVTLDVLNLLPKFNVFIALYPVSPNIAYIELTLLVVGENTVCTATKTITNLNLLNVSSVTNMQAMFRHT